MILVDTSVWIEFFRGRNQSIGNELQDLLDSDDVILAAPVRIEILLGCSKVSLPRLRQLLSALPVFYPDHETWARIDNWSEHAVDFGERFSAEDLLIASIAVDHSTALWSLDSDFERMEALGWLNLHHPA